jgi:gamma-glutamyltranspeptidase/glutathione hydrolase/leukotriene-C4 hydrolase
MYGGNESLKARGALSIAVPGEIAGLYEAWKHHGKLPWKRLVLPAARLALAFRISPYLRMQMEATRDGILGNNGTGAVYAPGGDILRAGDVCRNARLAQTLRAVAEHGPGVFYGGAVGARLVRDVREAGGIVTVEDLKSEEVPGEGAAAADGERDGAPGGDHAPAFCRRCRDDACELSC